MLTPQEFESKWTPEPFSGCWLWTGNAYGRGHIKRRSVSAHRLSWQIHRGEVPHGLLVLHKCDTRSCVNPDHLFLGTASDNARDSVNKGRWKKQNGELNDSSKLTELKVRIIRGSIDSLRALARRFGVSDTTIWKVRHRRTWQHV